VKGDEPKAKAGPSTALRFAQGDRLIGDFRMTALEEEAEGA
jgi:hypothetical protein